MDHSHELQQLRDITYTQGMILQARIELEAMLAENAGCVIRQETPMYGETEINALIEKHGVHHNAIMSSLYPQNR